MVQRVVSVFNPKGGQGKTMLAINLAAAASKLGLRTILFSTDIQDGGRVKSYGDGSYKFEIMPMFDEGMIHRGEYQADYIIVDYPAGYTKTPIGSTAIVPIIPSQNDYDSYLSRRGNALDNKRVIHVASNCDMRFAEQREFTIAMRKQGAAVVKRKSLFNKASNAQLTIFDNKYNKQSKVGESRAEIEAILNRTLEVNHG